MSLYEIYHRGRKLQKRIISNKNYTYRLLINLLGTNISDFHNALDIGCGTGTLDFYLAEKGVNVVGIDISKKAIKIAKTNAKNLNMANKTKFVVSKFPNRKNFGKFDLVICTEVLEHLNDDSGAINAIFTSLKKNGVCLFSSPLKSSVLYRLGMVEKFDKSVGHLRRYEPRQLVSLIVSNGFKIVDTKETQSLFRDTLFLYKFGSFFIKMANHFDFVSDIFNLFDNLLLPLGASDIIILAQKK